MVIGFHYHIPIKKSADGSFYTQSFYGLFLDSLCEGCTELVVFSYTPVKSEEPFINYQLKSSNIRMVDLGPHNTLPKRVMRFREAKIIIAKQIVNIDILLVRSPTPLLPVLASFRKQKKVVMYIVGDFLQSASELPFWRIKTLMIKAIGFWLRYTQNKLARNNTVISNNQYLLEKYKELAADTVLIKSTTLSPTDFFKREDTCTGPVVRILYTGRMDPLKGLFEIVSACERLTEKGFYVEFHLVGMLVKGLETLPAQLMEMASRGKFRDRIFFHGLKKVGDELNAFYRSADIYIIASKGMEGFPRTIWEAMANGLPVVASNLGAIPLVLRDQDDALLVKPGDVNSIEYALLKVIQNPVLRKKMITNGYRLAVENTLERQASLMVNTLAKIIRQ